MSDHIFKVLKEMGRVNQFDIPDIDEWPDLPPEFDIVELDRQAARISDSELLVFVDGEVSEIEEITNRLGVEQLDKFLDGYL